MREIVITSVRIDGFKSFAERTLVKLPTTPGFRLLGGRNEIEPALGANGAGKSSLFDAIFWCLYGTSLRGKRTTDLITWGKKNAHVSVRAVYDGTAYRITRQGPPERLYIDEEDATQAQVDELLGLTKLQFANAVCFGQGVDLFYDMSVPERGALISDVLELDEWTRFSSRCKSLMASTDARVRELENIIARQQGIIGNTDALKHAREMRDGWNEKHTTDVAEIARLLSAAIKDVTKLQKEFDSIPVFDNSGLKDAEQNIRALEKHQRTCVSDIGRVTGNIEHHNATLRFFTKNTVCPTCGQDIDRQFIKTKTAAINTTVAALSEELNRLETDASSTRDKKIKYETDAKAVSRREHGHQTLIHEAQSALRIATIRMQNCQATMDRLKNEHNPWIAQVATITDAIKQARQTLAETREIITTLQGKNEQFAYWETTFKRIRLFRMQRVLEVLQLETNTAAEALGLIGWDITLSTEIETKSGTMRPGVHISVQARADKRGREWSPGELQRVRIAIQIGLSTMIQRMRGVSYSLEIWDEPSNFLSTEGIASLLDLFRDRANTANKAVWLIDHRALIYSGFTEIWCAVKTADGTRIETAGI